MSEENTESSDIDSEQSDSFISKLTSSGGEYLDLLGELRSEEDELDLEASGELSFIVRPSSEEVAQLAEKRVRQKSQQDPPFDNPRPVIRESERQMMLLREDLIEKIEDIKRKEEESVSGAEMDTMLYIVDKNAGKTGKFTIFGGSESLIYNLAERQGWHALERELVLEANKIAAKKNNLHRHLLLDTVVVVPNEEEVL